MMRWTLALWLSASWAPVAMAQDTSQAVAEDGRVFGVVFRRGTADVLPGVTVRVGPSTATTGRDGAFDLQLPEGTHPVSVLGPNGVEKPAGSVYVGPGLASEILITWDPALPVLPTQTETPSAAVVDARQASEADGPTGTIAGTITSSEDGSPVVGARVFVRGRQDEAITGEDGTFVLEIPEGTWELSVVSGSFAAQTIPDVQVAAEQETAFAVSLVPAGLALDDFTVRAPAITGNTAALLDERRESTAVADVLGAEQMSRAGDSSAASALRRVTGLTLVGGRFIFVRGLGERYSQTLLNGAMLPSPEPERRVIPLDLFPAMVLDSVVIQKTFSPDMPAEFGGGVVRLRTRTFPIEPVFKVAVSGAFRGGVTGQTGSSVQEHGLDAFGVGAGPRSLPELIETETADRPMVLGDRFTPDGFTAEDLQGFGRALPGRWSPEDAVIRPDVGVQMAVGGGKRFNDDQAIGALAAFAWSNEWDYNEFNQQYFRAGTDETGLRPTNNFDFRETTNRTFVSGLFTLGGELAKGQEITSTTVVLRNTDANAQLYGGYYEEDDNLIRVQQMQWIERQLLSQQFQGDHDFGNGERPVHAHWRYVFSRATRIEPDRRRVRYDYSDRDEMYFLSQRGDSNGRFFSDLVDDAHDAALDLTIPVKIAKDRDMKIKFGGMAFIKNREVDTRRFTFLNRGIGPDLLTGSPEEIFSAENINPDGFQLTEVTQATDNYTGEQQIGAGYLMFEVPIMPWLDAMAGARVEHSNQVVSTFKLFDPADVPIVADLKTTDVLPAATLNFKPLDNVGIRLGYGRTVSRPEFRELSPAYFSGVVGDRPQFGNPDLRRATIENIDLRVEWFPDRGDVVSASGFYKQFANPIEQVVIIGADEALTPQNARAARNYGVELEVWKNLGFLGEKARDVYVAANATFIFSRIDLGDNTGVQTNNVRPLQGQSPWVINAQIGYDNPELGINAAILYNATGPRIDEVGSFGIPDSYVLPFHQLDVVVGVDLPRGFNLGLRGQNLLDSAERNRIGDTTVFRAVRPGWRLGARLEWDMSGRQRTWGSGKKKSR